MLPKLKILVIEQDARSLRQMDQLLRERGAIPRCLTSSEDAADLINREKFDGVIVDWDLANEGGRQFTERVRKSLSNSRVPITMLSARHSARAAAEGFHTGVTFFLSKPVGPPEVRRLINVCRASMLEERRRYQRARLEVPVQCTWENKRVTGKTIDISSSGLLLRLRESPEPGSPLRLDFTLPKIGRRFEIEALVARITPDNEVGVKFMGLSREQRELLMSYTDRVLGPQLLL
ncbi:MAG: PilZ domain-containing protein [Acidobacteria bacterium]|nr:PilZ domain-containing protein [Acidobacteriota bacterium]